MLVMVVRSTPCSSPSVVSYLVAAVVGNHDRGGRADAVDATRF